MKTIVFDGKCALCMATIDRVKNSSVGGEFDYVDFNDHVPDGIDLAEARKEIHVIDTDGHLHRNVEGIMEIMATSLRWRWLASIGRLPLIRSVLRWGYRLIARYRHGHLS